MENAGIAIVLILILAGGYAAGKSLYGAKYLAGHWMRDIGIACVLLIAGFAVALLMGVAK